MEYSEGNTSNKAKVHHQSAIASEPLLHARGVPKVFVTLAG